VHSPENQTVAAGSTVVLTVEATGAGPIGYQWFHNEKPLATPSISPILTLQNVSAGDAGSYYVVVFNNDGSATSQAATVSIGGSDPDQDGDGMPDAWELAHGLVVGINDANLDPDGDGVTNLQEFLAGTDPQDINSFLKVDEIAPVGADNSYTIRFNAASNKTYSILFADALPASVWNKLQDLTAAPTNRVVTVTNSAASAQQRFYRLVTPAQ
jgi:hypothetical protein